MRYECGGTREMILAGEKGSTRRKLNFIPLLFCPCEHFYEKYRHINSIKLRNIHKHELSYMLQGQISITMEM
jgi:hypothetical protein